MFLQFFLCRTTVLHEFVKFAVAEDVEIFGEFTRLFAVVGVVEAGFEMDAIGKFVHGKCVFRRRHRFLQIGEERCGAFTGKEQAEVVESRLPPQHHLYSYAFPTFKLSYRSIVVIVDFAVVMSAEAFGKRVLQDVHEESLNEVRRTSAVFSTLGKPMSSSSRHLPSHPSLLSPNFADAIEHQVYLYTTIAELQDYCS